MRAILAGALCAFSFNAQSALVTWDISGDIDTYYYSAGLQAEGTYNFSITLDTEKFTLDSAGKFSTFGTPGAITIEGFADAQIDGEYNSSFFNHTDWAECAGTSTCNYGHVIINEKSISFEMLSEPGEFYLDFRLKADEIINPDLYSFPGALPDFEKFTLFASENGKRYGSFNVNEPATIALLFPALIFALRRKCRQI